MLMLADRLGLSRRVRELEHRKNSFIYVLVE